MARRSAAVAVIALALVLAGCGGAPGDHARYDGLPALADDSDAVAVVTVSAVADETVDTTIATVTVDDAPYIPGLGTNRGDPVDLAVGDVLRIRQTSSTPTLETDGQYLLYLSRTGRSDDLENTYVITGADAGLYRRDGDRFVRVVPDSGGGLPPTIGITT